ncbi:phosphatase PAP2 family protein [Desulfovibrio sp. OttesenSCG-928-F07]|nr:phosphatase PAP2 family protein [Desulfovibrio sp. OttesenSCG-928-F07]
MNIQYKKDILVVFPTICMLLLVWLLWGSDNKVFFTEYRAQHPALTLYVTWFTQYARYIFYFFFAYMVFTAVIRKSWKPVIYVATVFLIQVIMSVLILHALKISIGRPRPLIGGEWQPFAFTDDYYSMPSGHTMESTILGLTHARYWKTTIVHLLCGILVAMIAFSRIYLSMHHISDILAGLILAYTGTTLLQKFVFARFYK